MKFYSRFAAVVLISATGAFYLLNHTSPIQPKDSRDRLQASFPVHTQPVRTAVDISPEPAVSVPERSRPVSKIAPATNEVRDEVRKNPEGTPASLLLFASTMGKRFQIATLSEENAARFFEDLYSCLDESQPIAAAARALCLRQGERLTHYYPALRANYDVMALKTSSEVRNLALRGRLPSQYPKFSR